MLINDSLIFLHPSTTAGSIIRGRIIADNPFDSWDEEHLYVKQIVQHPRHVTWDMFRESKHFINDISQYFIFTWARNPYDRFYQFFLHNLEQISSLLQDRTSSIQPIERWYYNPDFSTAFLKNKGLTTRCIPLYEYIYSQGEKMVDFVGRFESFEKDFQDLRSQVSVEINQQKNHQIWRETFQPEIRDLQFFQKIYTAQSIIFLNQYFKKDFECLGYPIWNPQDFQ